MSTPYFVTLSECEESPLVRSTSRINADPSLTLRMTKKKNGMTDQMCRMTDQTLRMTRIADPGGVQFE